MRKTESDHPRAAAAALPPSVLPRSAPSGVAPSLLPRFGLAPVAVAPVAVALVAVALVAVAVAACGEAPGPMLHRMRSYAGALHITREGATTQTCDLAFHRGTGNLQAKFTDGARVVTLLRGAGGAVSAFEDAVERPPTPVERARFAVVQALLDPGAISAVRPGAGTYRVQSAGVWYRVGLESQTGTRIHGQPR